MPQLYTLKDGRPYVHKRCGQATVVSGADFAGLCDPSQVCLGTICANCGGPDSVSAFYWEDTQEPLNEYRRRLRKEWPAIYRFWRFAAPVIGLIGGGLMGAIFIKRDPVLDVVIGSAVGLFAMWLIVGPAIAGAFGTKFYEYQ